MKAMLLLAGFVATATLLDADEGNLPTLKVGSEVYSKVTVTSVTTTHVYFNDSRSTPKSAPQTRPRSKVSLTPC